MTALLLHADLLGVQAPAAQNRRRWSTTPERTSGSRRGCPRRRANVRGAARQAGAVFRAGPHGVAVRPTLDLVIHFHGRSLRREQAVSHLRRHSFVAVINVGAGGGTYDRAFSDPGVFDALLDRIEKEAAAHAGVLGQSAASRCPVQCRLRAVRADSFASRDSSNACECRAPAGRPATRPTCLRTPSSRLAQWSMRRRSDVFIRFGRARCAARRRADHPLGIFPGTFASTTETTDVMVRRAGCDARPCCAGYPADAATSGEARSELRSWALPAHRT